MHRAQVVPLDLTVAQSIYMARAAGTARVAYNWALAEWKLQAAAWWKSGGVESYPSAFDLQRRFHRVKRDLYPWITEIASVVSDAAIVAVGEAMRNFRDGRAKYPRFKSRDAVKRSFVAAGAGRSRMVGHRRILLPRVGDVRIGARLRWPEASLRGVHVSERAGRWYAILSYELPDEVERAEREYPAAGVDVGLKMPLVVAAGDLSLHIGGSLAERLNVERRKLRRANQRLHRRVKGSGRRKRAQVVVARIHRRMACIRSDVQHKTTSQIAGMASRIGVETLAVRNMMRNGRLARSIADVGFYEIKRQLKYKADEVIEADRFYPSSKTCSACGSIKQDLKLSDRVFRCEHCGHECDRDVNAARNLERMAANCAVSARGAGSPAPKRKLRLSSLASKREVHREAGGEPAVPTTHTMMSGGAK